MTNQILLAALNSEQDDGQLEKIAEDFGKMLGPRREGKFSVLNFRETKPLRDAPPADLVRNPNSSGDLPNMLTPEGRSV